MGRQAGAAAASACRWASRRYQPRTWRKCVAGSKLARNPNDLLSPAPGSYVLGAVMRVGDAFLGDRPSSGCAAPLTARHSG